MLWLIPPTPLLVDDNHFSAQFSNTLEPSVCLLENLVVRIRCSNHILNHLQNFVDRGTIGKLLQPTHLATTMQASGILSHEMDLQKCWFIILHLRTCIAALKRANVLVDCTAGPCKEPKIQGQYLCQLLEFTHNKKTYAGQCTGGQQRGLV
jgi:hypothetical protein